jgi:hypothetical protein
VRLAVPGTRGALASVPRAAARSEHMSTFQGQDLGMILHPSHQNDIDPSRVQGQTHTQLQNQDSRLSLFHPGKSTWLV